MKNGITPIIIIVLVIVLVAIVFLGISTFKGDSSEKKKGILTEEKIAPTLDLSIDDSNELRDVVTIYANAATDDPDGVKSIVLPDGTEIEGTSVTYDVTENKNYTFKVIGNNGEESSLSINISNIRESSPDNPYLPEGFEHVGGDVESGYIIEDSYGNQFVWIPIPTGKVTRNTMLDSNYMESTSSASALVNSIAKNYGFYMGRFEASEYDNNGTKVAATMAGKTPWTDINYIDAANAASKASEAFEYPDGYSTAIINSFAWDSTLKWIDQTKENYSSMLNFGNYSGQIYPTGSTESDIVNNICDLAGNVREWTTEIYKGATTTSTKKGSKEQEVVLYRVVRGGCANLNKTAGSNTGYPENTSGTYWGFRTILFKD